MEQQPNNPWILTGSGRVVDLLDPDVNSIALEDIARNLSRLARFSGSTRGHFLYSVAQHSVLVADIVKSLSEDPLAPRYALLHDAHEAYVGDITSPVKRALGPDGLQALRDMTDRLDLAIWAHFGLPEPDYDMKLAVKRADMIALASERRDLMSSEGPDWQLGVEPMAAFVGPADPPELAYARFMDVFLELSTEISIPAINQRIAAREGLNALTAIPANAGPSRERDTGRGA